MVSIFTNPKQLVLEAQVDPQILVQAFQEQISEDDFLSRLKDQFSFSGRFVGYVAGRDVKLRYGFFVRNSLEPTMHVQIDSAPSGGSVVRTRYTTNPFVKVFLILWISVASFFSLSILAGTMSAAPDRLLIVCFPLLGLLLVVLMRIFAYYSESKLEEFVYNVIGCAQAQERGIELPTQNNKA